MIQRNLKALLTIVAALAVAACERERTPDQMPDAGPQVQPAPPTTMPGPTTPVAAVRVTDVDVGQRIGPDNRLIDDDDADEFLPMDTVYVVVATDGTGDNTVLTARWLFEDGQTVEETTQTVSPTGPARHQFNVSRPSGWPVGKYIVEIMVNGQKVDTEDFEVKTRR